jgi:hypothetical protein
MSLLMRVPPNLVQSIRAYRASELQKEAGRLGHHFLYAHCANALTKQQVCARIGEQFTFPRQCSKNFEALRNCITNVIAEAGPQPGFIAVLDQLPNTQKFDKEARETLLDVFRDAAEFWAEKKVPFRVFYSFEEPQSPQSVGWVGAGRLSKRGPRAIRIRMPSFPSFGSPLRGTTCGSPGYNARL